MRFFRRSHYVVVALFLLVQFLPADQLRTLLPKAHAAPGDGHMLLFWDGGSAPSGWSCVSCSPGDDFYQRFIRGNDAYGATGGAATHTHTADGSVDETTTPMPARSRNTPPNDIHENDHTHTFSPTIGTASNLPEYRQLQVIRHDTAGDPATLPAGAIAIFDAAVPTGWTRYSAQDGRYIRGENTVGTTGGSNTHTHAITGTTGTAQGADRERNINGTQTNVADGAHTHDASGTSASTSNEPPYIEVILGELDAGAAPPNDMYAMWDDDPTTAWSVKSESGGVFHQAFFKGASSYGATGGSESHSHADVSYESGLPSATTTSRTNGTVRAADDQHTHTINVTNFSDVNHLPPYIDVIIAKKQAPSTLEQSSYRWFRNQDSTDAGTSLAAENTAATAPPQGKEFRLRFTIGVSDVDMGLNGETMKLQVAQRVGACDTSFIGETYSDVSDSSGVIRFANNPTPDDGDSLTTIANDPTGGGGTVVAQSYEESGGFSNTEAAIDIGEDGLWDVALVDDSAPASTAYCFRVVRSSGSSLDYYSEIPEITTDDGLGHMLLFWDGVSVPSGWSCVSCNPGDDFYQRFPRGETTYGATGGSAAHSHTADGTVGAQSALSGRSSAGTGFIRAHDHSITPIIGNASNLPVYRQLQVIRFDSSGTPTTIPAGAIAIFDAAVPTGWTRYSVQDGNYIRGESTVGSTGGSNTHTHTITGTTSIGTGTIRGQNTNNTQGPAPTDTHTHTISDNSDSVSNEPPYIETILGSINANGSAPSNMLAMWDGVMPGTWTSQSDAVGAFNQNFMKPAATYGATGGSATHSHGTTITTSSGPSATATTRTGGTNLSSATHTHQVTIDNFSDVNHLPPYIDVIIGKLTGTNTGPNIPTALDQIRVSDSSSVAVGGFTNNGQVEFTAQATDTDNPDDLQLCVEVLPIGSPFTNVELQCGTAATYSGSAVSVSVTISGLSDGTSYHWQARIKDGAGATSGWVSFGANPEANADFIDDSTDPSGTVFDGSTTGFDADFNDGSLDTLEANWNITDGGSGISEYEYAIGTSAGGTDIVAYTSNGTTDSVTAGSLTLETSLPYYFSIRTTDNADNQIIITSDSQLVAPTLTFSTSTSGGVQFDNLNANNNYTDTKTTVLTTSTNARNGYAVRAYTTGLLENSYFDVISNFTGGTYAAPDTWQSGDVGYGYTSNDTQVQGSNIFNAVTCPGGGSGSSCYAPFSQTAPGDIVADNESTITGTPITSEQFIITHRVTTDANQEAGQYQTIVIFQATAKY